MKEQLSTITNRKAKVVWYGLVITLTVCTVFVIFNRTTNSNDRSYQQIELLKDSLLTQSQLIEKPSLFSTWMNVVQQKQLLDVIQGKDQNSVKSQKVPEQSQIRIFNFTVKKGYATGFTTCLWGR